MSKRLDVLKAVKALIATALPGAQVLGLDGDEAPPGRVPAGGRVIVRSGDPGEPEVCLSPLSYSYSHRIPIEIIGFESGGLTSEEALDAMLTAIGDAIAADRYLGGLCEFVDAVAPETDDIFVDGAKAPRGAEPMIVASYTISTPL